ncbi:unnamed protein product [Protopolystoma xenopodis]|uniref:Uncharacterized protein n=1 Tax=Protopolystoma xenopodis TaxID=117903 RepID=A0A448WHL3_9PLAT|nr:unnamed protein product [Protopolystoma xenopodis]
MLFRDVFTFPVAPSVFPGSYLDESRIEVTWAKPVEKSDSLRLTRSSSGGANGTGVGIGRNSVSNGVTTGCLTSSCGGSGVSTGSFGHLLAGPPQPLSLCLSPGKANSSGLTNLFGQYLPLSSRLQSANASIGATITSAASDLRSQTLTGPVYPLLVDGQAGQTATRATLQGHLARLSTDAASRTCLPTSSFASSPSADIVSILSSCFSSPSNLVAASTSSSTSSYAPLHSFHMPQMPLVGLLSSPLAPSTSARCLLAPGDLLLPTQMASQPQHLQQHQQHQHQQQHQQHQFQQQNQNHQTHYQPNWLSTESSALHRSPRYATRSNLLACPSGTSSIIGGLEMSLGFPNPNCLIGTADASSTFDHNGTIETNASDANCDELTRGGAVFTGSSASPFLGNTSLPSRQTDATSGLSLRLVEAGAQHLAGPPSGVWLGQPGGSIRMATAGGAGLFNGLSGQKRAAFGAQTTTPTVPSAASLGDSCLARCRGDTNWLMKNTAFLESANGRVIKLTINYVTGSTMFWQLGWSIRETLWTVPGLVSCVIVFVIFSISPLAGYIPKRSPAS